MDQLGCLLLIDSLGFICVFISSNGLGCHRKDTHWDLTLRCVRCERRPERQTDDSESVYSLNANHLHEISLYFMSKISLCSVMAGYKCATVCLCVFRVVDVDSQDGHLCSKIFIGDRMGQQPAVCCPRAQVFVCCQTFEGTCSQMTGEVGQMSSQSETLAAVTAVTRCSYLTNVAPLIQSQSEIEKRWG